MKCSYHPDVDTELRCGKCGKPICPLCLVETPVGARCPECGRLQKLPTFTVNKKYYLRAILTAAGMAFACGAAWWAARPVIYFNFLLAAGFGYAIGEVVGRSVNRKRGKGLAIIAGIAVGIAYLISVIRPGGSGWCGSASSGPWR